MICRGEYLGSRKHRRQERCYWHAVSMSSLRNWVLNFMRHRLAIEVLLEHNFIPTRTVVLSFGFDEEAGGHQVYRVSFINLAYV
jgi:hypothetical protein